MTPTTDETTTNRFTCEMDTSNTTPAQLAFMLEEAATRMRNGQTTGTFKNGWGEACGTWTLTTAEEAS